MTTKHREPWLANAVAHDLVRQTWLEATAWLVGEYVLMPDHLHCFCAPNNIEFRIERWLAYWKFCFRRLHGRAEWQWQSRGWHHRLRDNETREEKWHYVRLNPVRGGLVEQPEDWPYQGRVHVLWG